MRRITGVISALSAENGAPDFHAGRNDDRRIDCRAASFGVTPSAALQSVRDLGDRATDQIIRSVKYRRIARSVAEVGVIEPLVVARPKAPGAWMLLDGHVRLEILKDLGETETRCLVADDDEAFTYNRRVNRLATIQEHDMIVRALEPACRRRSSPERSMWT